MRRPADTGLSRVAGFFRTSPSSKRSAVFLGMRLERRLLSTRRGFLGYMSSCTRRILPAPGFGTRYVVLAYEVLLHRPLWNLSTCQHNDCLWMDVPFILESEHVHSNTQAYSAGGRAGSG